MSVFTEDLGGYVAGLIIGAIVGTLIAFAVVAAKASDDIVPPTEQEARDIVEWIPPSCCRTNSCCFKVKPSALERVGADDIKVVATGQVLKRTGWSRDGLTWRCACDYQGEKGWVVHLKAQTRCVFPAPDMN